MMQRYQEYKDSGVQWLGEIPSHWTTVPFKSVFDLEKGLNITKANLKENGIPVVSYGQIHAKYNPVTHVSQELIRYVSADYLKSHAQCLAYKDDFLFADTSEDISGSGNFVRKDDDDILFAGYHTIIARNKVPECGSFLAFLLQSNKWKTQLWVNVHGVKVFSINRAILFSTKLILPPSNEQQSIASYLNTKCENLNKLIGDKEKQITLLHELKQRTIVDAVTKGLDPKVKFKATQISWLKEIPEHWLVSRAKHLFNKEQRPIKDGDEIVTCFRDGEVTLRKNRRLSGFTEATDYSHYQHICKGDLVIHQMDAFAGASGVADSDGMGTPVLSVCTPKTDNIMNDYYAHVLRLMGKNGFILSLYRGIRERSSDFRFDTFAKQFLPVPPFTEQQTIVSYINDRTTKIDTLISKLQQEIEAIKEYKQRLISDVVTGQIKVC
jgi:type I restriction enzyme S subunit